MSVPSEASRSTRPAETARRPGLWDRLDTPTKVVAAGVTSVAAILGGYLAFFGSPLAEDPADPVEATPEAIAARQVQRCMNRHDLPTPRVQEHSRDRSETRFKRCDWPPLTTSLDGYSEVRDEIQPIPGRDNAHRYNEVHTLRGTCDELRLTFLQNHMDQRVFRTTELQLGRLIAVTEGLRRGRPTVFIRRLSRVPTDVRLAMPSSNAFATDTFNVLKAGHVECWTRTVCGPTADSLGRSHVRCAYPGRFVAATRIVCAGTLRSNAAQTRRSATAFGWH